MQITVTGRHVEITEAIRAQIEKKLEKIDSLFDHVIDVRVVLSVERYRQFAEITVSGRNHRFHSKEATDDMYVSIDKAVEKIERQLRRHTSKVRQAKRRRSAEFEAAGEASASDEGEGEEEIEQQGPYRLSVSDKIPPKPMSVEEAVLQIEASDDEFLAFVNEQTDDVNVVFKKKDGGYGLLRRSE